MVEAGELADVAADGEVRARVGAAPSAGRVRVDGRAPGTARGVNPQRITVPLGSRVTFVNNDSAPHDMASDPHPEPSFYGRSVVEALPACSG